MDGSAYLLTAIILAAALAVWISARFETSLRSYVECGVLVTGCVALLAVIVHERGASIDPACPRVIDASAQPGEIRPCETTSKPVAERAQDKPQAVADAGDRNASPDAASSGPANGVDRATAVYDITAHTVYLPNGARLEAHSGLGDRLDDPRYVHEHMRGATPPNTYELILRERPFHGVRALRLIPVGGQNPFGRKGLLAHTYMLGPNGHSNGCVVFKDYKTFLQAFDAGEIKRLLVVARFN